MWVKVFNLRDLKHGDKVRGVCFDCVLREGVIDLESRYYHVNIERYFNYDGNMGLIRNITEVMFYDDDMYIDNCEVWR